MTTGRRFPFLLISAFLLTAPTYALPVAGHRVGGIWAGVLDAGVAKLRIVFHIVQSDTAMTATMDSPDQGARGIPVTSAQLEGDTLTLSVLSVVGQFKGVVEAGDTVVTGTWKQGGMMFPLVLRRSDTPIEVKRPQVPATPYPYREQNVSYPSLQPGIELAGTLTIPDGKGPYPAVILISGSGAQDRDETVFNHKPFLVLADYLTRRGMAVLRVDDRGVGGSGGTTMQSTMEDFAQDVLGGLRYLASRPEINDRAVGLIGHSEGGLVAPFVASRSADVAFIVLMAAPGLPGEEIVLMQAALIARQQGATEQQIEQSRTINRQIYDVVKTEPDSAARHRRLSEILTEARGQTHDSVGSFDSQIAVLTSPWFRYFLTYDPRPALRSVRCPALALIGEKDIQVPPKENLEAIAKAFAEGGNARAAVKELPGLNHLFQSAQTGAVSEYATIEETISPSALTTVGEWIDHTIRASAR